MALRAYICGTMAGRFSQEVTSERNEVSEALLRIGVIGVDPAKSESQLWQGTKSKISTKYKLRIISAMVARDLFLIRRSDLLICITGDSCSDGSWKEISYAQMIGIPVILIAPKRYKGEISGWTNVLIPRENIVPSLKKAVNLIKRKYLKEYAENKRYFDAAIKKAKYSSINKGK